MTKNYIADLRDALRQLVLMASEREQLETKIAKQEKRVAALYELVQTDEGSAALTGLVEGITDACRVVFRAAEKPLLPAEVRDRVQALGLPPKANLLASIHTTIRRMKDAGEITETSVAVQSGGVASAYTWVNEARSMNALADRVRGLTPLDAARDNFKQAHDAKLAREKAKPPLTPGEAKRMMEDLRSKK